MEYDKSKIISDISEFLLNHDKSSCTSIISNHYPHRFININKRSYSLTDKFELFIRDGFIDRYTGERLVNPGILKAISYFFPKEFPYHPHWRMENTHIAYWELTPTVDHIYPIALGGSDSKDNTVTTSMKNNSIKSNYTIDEIHWSLHPPGNISDWDGLTLTFIKIVDDAKELLNDNYIKKWYTVSKKFIN